MVPSIEIRSGTQNINIAKLIKWIGELIKFKTKFGEIIKKNPATITKDWRKFCIWKAHSWQTKNIGLNLEFLIVDEFLSKIKGAELIESQIEFQINKPKPK